MKDKDVKKMLSDGANQVLPSDGVKNNIKYRIGADDEQTVLVGGGTKALRNKKPLVIVAAFALVVAILCAVLIPYYLKNSGTSPSNPNISNKISAINSADDFYVYGAASMGALISAQEQTSTAASGSAKNVAKSAVKSTSYTLEQISALLDEYMPFVEGMIGGGEITAQTSTETDENYSDYDYCVIIGYPHIDGGCSTYVLYYNRDLSETKTDGNETEETYNIEGVLCVDGVDYMVKGVYEYEAEGGETEEEVTFTVYDGVGNPYITLGQETEQEQGESELGYTYTFYTNGKKTKTVEVEYEAEDGETELSLTVEEGNNEYEFKFFLDRSTEMTVKAELNDEKYTIIVTIVDEKYYYSLK